MALKSPRTQDHQVGPFGWDRDLPRLTVFVALLGVVWVTLWQLHPELLLSSSTTTGGDTGAHYALPAFLRSALLPQGHLTGWYPGWYDGFPLYTYYFVVPDLIAALGSYVLPYAVAFKFATIVGSIAMPFAAYSLGRLFGLRAPIPSTLAIATLPFLFDSTFTIDGGNLFSTLAGEYAFSLGLALSLVVFGLFARGVRNGRGSILTPLVMAVCLGSHLIPYLYAIGGALVVTALALLPPWLLNGDDAQGSTLGLLAPLDRLSRRAALWWSLRTALIGAALSGWWWVPFVTGQGLANPMGYVNVTDYAPKLFPGADNWVFFLAAIGVFLGFRRLSRFVVTVTALGTVAALGFILAPQGSLWNERILPLWFISVYLLAGWAVGEVLAAIARRHRTRQLVHFSTGEGNRRPAAGQWLPGAALGPLIALGLAVVVVVPPMIPGVIAPSTLKKVGVTVGANQVSSWAAWNYSGVEAKPAYPEYRGLISTMERLSKRFGCGRAMWEYSPDLDRFGTPMGLMLLPYWTNGCIGSQEGLFFEASATTPYHFLIQAEVSTRPSNPQVGLPYGGVDVGLGVKHLQMLGVKYLMVSSPEVATEADADASLTKVATSGPWDKATGGASHATWSIYLIGDSSMVTGMTHLPVVVPGIAATSTTWKQANVAWFLNPERREVPLAATGPAWWPRGRASTTTSPEVEPVSISRIQHSGSTMSFDASGTGRPVLVKVSYSPRWHVAGAEGPYRVSPNLMVVVPTSSHVVMTYGGETMSWLGLVVSMLGMVALVSVAVLRRRTGRHELPKRPLLHRL